MILKCDYFLYKFTLIKLNYWQLEKIFSNQEQQTTLFFQAIPERTTPKKSKKIQFCPPNRQNT